MEYINHIFSGDCISILKSLPDNSVDITFADPPFNLKKRYNKYADNQDREDYLNWSKKWIEEIVRITKPTGSIFIHNIPKWLTYYSYYLNEIAEFQHWITWNAPSALTSTKKPLQPAHYGILFYAKDINEHKYYKIRYPHKRERKSKYLSSDYGGKKNVLHPFGPSLSDIWLDINRIKHKKYRDAHPCQLPVHLLERLILMSTDEDDIVLDPFMGTGTTAIAAKRLGRKYIGIEIDGKYVEIAEKKLTQEESNSKIGKSWVSFFLEKIVTIRDIDWEHIAPYFIIPENIKDIDFTEIQLKSSSVPCHTHNIQDQQTLPFKQ